MNPLQQHSEASAPSTKVNDNGFHSFNRTVGRDIFDPLRYSAAIGKKLTAVLEEGALEKPEFTQLFAKFSSQALILVALSSSAVAQKGLNPGKDVGVLLALEDLVMVAEDFIPLIEKLYESYEGKGVTEVEIKESPNAEEITTPDTQEKTASTDSEPKFQPKG